MFRLPVFTTVLLLLGTHGYSQSVNCRLENVDFLNSTQAQADALSNVGAVCELSETSLTIKMHGLVEVPRIKACDLEYEVSNNTNYNFEIFSLRVVSYDASGYQIQGTGLQSFSVRPGSSFRETKPISLVACEEIDKIDIGWGAIRMANTMNIPDDTLDDLNSLTSIYSSLPRIELTSSVFTIFTE